MSNKSQEKMLAWVGAVAGVVGVVLSIVGLVHPVGFPISPSILAISAVAAFLCASVAISLARFWSLIVNRHDTETESLRVTVEIKDKSGTDAILTRSQKYRANRKVVSHTYTVGGIASDGTVTAIKIDGEDIPQSQWEKEIKGTRVTKTKEVFLAPGKTIDRKLELHLRDSFIKSKEALHHEVSSTVEKLVLEVNFPVDRRPIKVEGFLAFGNETHAQLDTLQMNEDRTKAWLSIDNPQPGGTYKFIWEW